MQRYTVPLEGRSILEVGIILKHALLKGDLPLCDMARYTNCINVGSVVDSLPVDVLPLPVEPATAEEVRVLNVFQAGCSLEEITQGFAQVA